MRAEDFFNDRQNETLFFDETPAISTNRPLSTINTSSIDTAALDPYRQGVELTRLQHHDAGTIKIHAGEPGHKLRRNRFGMDKNFREGPTFEELDYFNPLYFLRAQEADSPLFLDIITFPIITGDNDQIENFYFNGVIEPLTIRAAASFFSIEVPFIAHAVRGTVMAGNSDQTWASDAVVTVDYRVRRSHIPFLDYVDMMNDRPLNGYFKSEKSAHMPFEDARLVRNVIPSSSYEADMVAAMSHMTGSTSTYISSRQVSYACGWTYDSTPLGTDSVTFGGRTY